MQFENVELHNVVELEQPRGVPGVVLRRVPRKVRDVMNRNGRWVSSLSSGCEVRFVTDHPVHRIRLFAGEDTEVIVYCGDFLHSRHTLPGGVLKAIQLDAPAAFANVKPEMLSRNFSGDVWRYVFARSEVSFVGIESLGGNVRPPAAAEKPPRRWLAYGSSITHNVPETGHPQVAAKMLGVDVLNLGHSGACHIEHEMSDFLATRGDWDFATAELGVNMRTSYTAEQFHERASYFIDRMVESNPDKHIAIITHFPTGFSHAIEDNATSQRQREFDDSSRSLVAAKKHPKLHLIEGASILDRFDLHSVDLLHPSTLGQMQMGMNLAAKLAEILA